MIKVDLTGWKNVSTLAEAEHAGKICYQSKMPEIKQTEDEKVVSFVNESLFKVSHHTALEHSSFTFDIEGISVGDITVGLHLAHVFYNSDQRSGRYCAKMFEEPDFGMIENYIINFWPEAKRKELKKIMNYIKSGVGIYHDNIENARKFSAEYFKRERPFVSEEILSRNAPKVAQEQMRSFVSVVFPTAFKYTINAIALVAMWESAWTPAGKYVTDLMVTKVLEKFPNMRFMFKEERRRKGEWAMAPKNLPVKIKYKPGFKLLEVFGEKDFIVPDPEIMHPVDKLHFLPELMDNSVGTIFTQVEISTATMGQDQRHRTLGRSQPEFTGSFYLPPIPAYLRLEADAIDLMADWRDLSRIIPKSLAMILAPYGAMVTYKKRGSFNAIAHEQGKRLCWCAQEEIYHAGRLFRLAIEKKKGKRSKLLRIFEPPCYRTGKCAEGARYCGRDRKLRKNGNYFPEREV